MIETPVAAFGTDLTLKGEGYKNQKRNSLPIQDLHASSSKPSANVNAEPSNPSTTYKTSSMESVKTILKSSELKENSTTKRNNNSNQSRRNDSIAQPNQDDQPYVHAITSSTSTDIKDSPQSNQSCPETSPLISSRIHSSGNDPINMISHLEIDHSSFKMSQISNHSPASNPLTPFIQESNATDCVNISSSLKSTNVITTIKSIQQKKSSISKQVMLQMSSSLKSFNDSDDEDVTNDPIDDHQMIKSYKNVDPIKVNNKINSNGNSIPMNAKAIPVKVFNVEF
jgi:hypothetical protein